MAGHLNSTLKEMRKCFATAKEHAPAIIFLDEVDAIGDRAKYEGHNASYDRQFINCLLECMDGAGRREGVVVIAATNSPENLDAALLRSGRLDRTIWVTAPDREARAKILQLHLGNNARNPGFDDAAIDRLVGPLEGYTGADIERLVRLVRRHARSCRRPIVPQDFIVVLPPMPTPSRDELYRISVHEAGHAVVSHLNGRTITVVRLSSEISPEGLWRAGVTETDVSVHLLQTETYMKAELVALLAGHAAEEVILGDRSVGAGSGLGSDLARATDLAVKIEATFGLGGGLMRLIDSNQISTKIEIRDPRLQARVEMQLAAAYHTAKDMLAARRSGVERLAGELVQRGTLTGRDVTSLIEG